MIRKDFIISKTRNYLTKFIDPIAIATDIYTIMKELGKFVMYCTPGLLVFGPVLLAIGLNANLYGIIGGLCLGFGLVGMFYYQKK
jgi:hypothetical protein